MRKNVMKQEKTTKMTNERENFKKQWLIFSISMVGIFLMYLPFSFIVRRMTDLRCFTEDDYSYVFQVDAVYSQKDSLVLEGFAFHLGKDAEIDDIEILLYDKEKNRLFYPKTESISRSDVDQYFLCEYDYTDSGYIASYELKKLDIYEKNYEIIVADRVNKRRYKTGSFLVDGEVVFTDPTKYIPLNVEGTELEEVVNNGVLRVYRPDVGVYVYQYEKNLYWITDEKFNFEDNKTTVMQYQVETTQKERLPQKRLENGWYWDNIGFVFEQREMKDHEYGKYRVAIYPIPKRYSITKGWTGYYTDKWTWIEYFRLYYNETVLTIE